MLLTAYLEMFHAKLLAAWLYIPAADRHSECLDSGLYIVEATALLSAQVLPTLDQRVPGLIPAGPKLHFIALSLLLLF